MIFDGCDSLLTSLMKKIVGGSSHSSAHAVVSNDDLLIEILLRLPTSSLRVFKSVSKRWLALITDPHFTLRRRQIPLIDPPSGLMFIKQHALFVSAYESVFKFVSLDTKRIPSSPPTTTFNLQIGSQKVEIFQSCNGLFLCRNRNHQLLVYNPCTNRSKTIDDPPCSNLPGFDLIGIRMAFDPSKSPHYKILYARMAPPDHLLQAQIEIYSSETCSWSVCGDLLPYDHLHGFWGGIYWNGGIHWLRYKLDVEDPYITITPTPQADGGIHWLKYRLDVEHPHITVTPTPPTAVGGVHKLFESGGCLLLLCTPVDSKMQLHIYEMCKRRLVWVEKYFLDLGDVMMKYRKTWMKKHDRRYCELEWLWINCRVQCIMIEKKEDDSFLVMEIFGKIIQYKIVSKTIHKLYELMEPDRYYSNSINFIASFADV